MVLFQTGDSTSEDTTIIALELVNNDWFKRNLIGALELMCNENNWMQRGAASVEFARDKANEMLEGLQIDVIIPVIPIGLIAMLPTATIPDKWLKLAGQGISKITYPELFAIYGYTYGGAGNTFNLPTMIDLMPMGAGSLVALGADAGSAIAGIEQTNLPNVDFLVTDPGHNHAVTDPGHVHAQRVGNNLASNLSVGGTGSNQATQTQATTSSTRLNTDSKVTGLTVNSNTTGIAVNSQGSGTPIDILNPVRGLNFIIYAGH